MGRFAYQPLSEEFAKDSQPGQLLMNRFDAHILANRNGIIVSKTKEIEDKIADINELKHDVDEQTDVISNLIEDLNNFLEGGFAEAEDAQNKTYAYDKILMAKVNYLQKLYIGMTKKFDRLTLTVKEYKEANDLQEKRLKSYEESYDAIIDDIGTLAYVEKEYTTIMALKLAYK